MKEFEQILHGETQAPVSNHCGQVPSTHFCSSYSVKLPQWFSSCPSCLHPSNICRQPSCRAPAKLLLSQAKHISSESQSLWLHNNILLCSSLNFLQFIDIFLGWWHLALMVIWEVEETQRWVENPGAYTVWSCKSFWVSWGLDASFPFLSNYRLEVAPWPLGWTQGWANIGPPSVEVSGCLSGGPSLGLSLLSSP